MGNGFDLDAELERTLNRRNVLRLMAGGVAAVGVLPLLAACGGDSEGEDEDQGEGALEATEDTTTPATTGGSTSTPAASPAATEEEEEATPETEASPDASPEGAAGEGTPDLAGASLTVYSGRNEELVGPIIEQFQEETGIEVEVRYGDTAELAAQILEEGDGTPADVYFAQDAGALGAVAQEGLFMELDEDILQLVDERFRSDDDFWVGITGRARVVVYNSENVEESEIPDSILGFTDPAWEGRLGWAPTNGSFQAFVTALRVIEGEDVAREWLEGIQANNPRVFEGNTPIVEAVNAGEIDAGFVNHYYLLRLEAEAGEDLPGENYVYTNGDPGSLINVAGAGIIATSENVEAAQAFLRYMLSEEAQTYFATETFEYPLASGVETDEDLIPLSEIETPDIDLSNLEDLEGTLELLRDTGVL